MKADLKQHKQVFKDLLEIAKKLQNECKEGDNVADLNPYNIDLKLKIIKEGNEIYTREEDYNIFIQLFLESIDITLSVEEFAQKKVKFKGINYVNLSDLKDEFSLLNEANDEDEIAFKKIKTNDLNYLDKKPFLGKNEQKEAWNVKMIDSIINNIFKKECSNSSSENVRPRRKKSKGTDLSSRPFVCQYKNCSSAFKRFEHLKRHYRIHTGERPFKCKYPGCFKKFARSDNLSQHLKIHNTGQGNYPNDSTSFYENKFGP
ncbi:Zn-finger [Trachipleistophora hominis]|uniref:Zn-finger n=1 Tax=Trachipleistophora hominis TaxID=72359 RepID=L7JZF9_TRAHO|nr:Zn-finger [Trachipleistophora hominis]